MRSADHSWRSAGRTTWLLVLALGCVLCGRTVSAETSQENQAARVKEFLSDPNVATCTLEMKPISELGFPDNYLPQFVRAMQTEGRESVRHGRITLADRPFRILLGDRLERGFYLFDVEKRFGPYWWGSWSLHSYHKIDEKFYEFVVLEGGDRIAARPYRGPLGTIRIGQGGRELEKAEFNGSVHQKGYVAAPVGTIKKGWPGWVVECKIPVGDYTSYMLHVMYDNLRIDISNNYHTSAQGRRNDSNRQVVYGMQVREDQPCVLDFSNKPVVVFDEPPATQTTFSRRDEIQFAAVLVDPKLDIMIRGLDDMSIEVEHELPDGHKTKGPKSLDPQVVITRANGEIVAEGVMPFG